MSDFPYDPDDYPADEEDDREIAFDWKPRHRMETSSSEL